jgi:hypothetical protein
MPVSEIKWHHSRGGFFFFIRHLCSHLDSQSLSFNLPKSQLLHAYDSGLLHIVNSSSQARKKLVHRVDRCAVFLYSWRNFEEFLKLFSSQSF